MEQQKLAMSFHYTLDKRNKVKRKTDLNIAIDWSGKVL